jgi:16S rRNA G966 N2-methylase RsmD
MANISDLKFDPKNARKRTDSSSRLIQESLQRYGAARSIVIDEDNRILAGNGTIEGAKALGLTKLRVVEASGDEIIAVRRSGLSEDDKVGLALADNRAAELSDWDAQMLQQLSEEHDIAPWFDKEDLEALLQDAEQLEPIEGNTDPDDVPEPPADPITKPGDLWILGNHRLLCGDSTNIQHVERLMDGQKAQLLLTDPPYGIGISANPVRQKHQKKDWDAQPIDDQTLAYFNSITTASIIWGGNYFGLPPAQCFYVWDKKQPEDFSLAMCELAWTNISGPAKIFRLSVTSYKKEHPTQKPVELLEWCLAKAEGIVLDPFGGSGSTLVACEKTSRHCRMMELDPAYVDCIVKRWEDFTGNTAVCIPSDSHFTEEHQEAA